jgi:hypothetical protein
MTSEKCHTQRQQYCNTTASPALSLELAIVASCTRRGLCLCLLSFSAFLRISIIHHVCLCSSASSSKGNCPSEKRHVRRHGDPVGQGISSQSNSAPSPVHLGRAAVSTVRAFSCIAMLLPGYWSHFFAVIVINPASSLLITPY